MANCNNLFKYYNSAIRLADYDRNLLLRVRESLRSKMSHRFQSLKTDQIVSHKLEFQSQGSFVMDTIIKPIDDDFDLDDGVYFVGGLPKSNRPPTSNFHKWVMYAVGEDESYGTVTDKESCVRVEYKKEKFHIDLPIYYADNSNDPDLATKSTGWILSNPIKFIDWFERKTESGFNSSFLLEASMFSEFQTWQDDIRKKDVQLRRIVRYLKGWSDNLRGDMPPGIVMTILAAENYIAHERDDIALRDTLIKINDYLKNNNCKCYRPTTPIGEDLFNDYSLSRKQYFLDRLETFVSSANQAIASDNQKDACLKWQRHLGNRFPCSLAADEIETAKTYQQPAIIGDTAKSA